MVEVVTMLEPAMIYIHSIVLLSSIVVSYHLFERLSNFLSE